MYEYFYCDFSPFLLPWYYAWNMDQSLRKKNSQYDWKSDFENLWELNTWLLKYTNFPQSINDEAFS